MNITKLLKRFFMSFMFHAAEGEGGGGDLDLAGMFEQRDGGMDESGGEIAGANGEVTDESELVLDPEEQDVDPDAEDDPVFEIPVGDGKTITKTQSELIAEASKYHGANKKFEEAAAIRKEAETLKAQLPEREKQLGTVLQHYIRESQAIMAAQQPNWEALLAQDPAEYTRVRHNWEQHQARLQEARGIQAQLDQRNAEAQAVTLQGRLSEERNKLIEAIPEWKDPAKAAEGAKAITTYLGQQGIPAEMLGTIDSAPVLLIARKAMLYDQAIARQKSTQQGVKTAQRVERPGASQVTPKRALAKANAAKAFNANPSVNTLASFFE